MLDTSSDLGRESASTPCISDKLYSASGEKSISWHGFHPVSCRYRELLLRGGSRREVSNIQLRTGIRSLYTSRTRDARRWRSDALLYVSSDLAFVVVMFSSNEATSPWRFIGAKQRVVCPIRIAERAPLWRRAGYSPACLMLVIRRSD